MVVSVAVGNRALMERASESVREPFEPSDHVVDGTYMGLSAWIANELMLQAVPFPQNAGVSRLLCSRANATLQKRLHAQMGITEVVRFHRIR